VKGVGLQTFVASAMIAQLIAGMATRDALFLAVYAPTDLPFVMGLSAVLSLIVVAFFSRLLVRWSPDRVMPAAFTLNAVLFVVERALPPAPMALMTYLHTMVLGAVLVSGFWTLMTEHFDPHSAKRVFGRIGAGASIGGIVGGLAAAGAGSLVATANILPLLAALNVACAIGLQKLPPPRAGATPVDTTSDDAPTGFTLPYLRHLAVFVVIAAIADVALDYVFKARVYERDDRVQFFALFYASAGAASFLLQVLVARRLLQRIGLAGTLVMQPIVIALGSAFALIAPGLGPVSIVRGGDTALRTSLFKASYELLYTPLRPAHKRAVKTTIDVSVSRLGGLTGSALVLAAVSCTPDTALKLLLGVAAIACLAMITLVALLHRGYVKALADSLAHAAIHLGPDDVEDATTRKTLAATTMGLDAEVLRKQMEALRSGEIARVRDVIAGDVDPSLVAFTLPLLARDDLVEETTRALRKIAPRITGHLVDALLDPDQPRLVRRRIPRVLIGSVTQRSVDGLSLGLASNSFDIRHRCALALERLSDLGPTLVIDRRPVLDAVLAETKLLGDSHERERLDQIFVLLGLVLDRRPLKLAYRALATTDPALRGTGLEYLENVLPPDIRSALEGHLGPPAPRPAPRPVAAIAKVLLESLPALDDVRPEHDPI